MKVKRICDPAVCDHCIYLGEGDFVCMKQSEPILVVDEWTPTDEYLWCQRKKNIKIMKER